MNEAYCQLVRVTFLCQANVMEVFPMESISIVLCSSGNYIHFESMQHCTSIVIRNCFPQTKSKQKKLSLSKLVAVLLKPTTTKPALLQVCCLVLFTTLPCWMVSLQIAKLMLLFLVKKKQLFQAFRSSFSKSFLTGLAPAFRRVSLKKKPSLLFASPRPHVSTKPPVIASLCLLLYPDGFMNS